MHAQLTDNKYYYIFVQNKSKHNFIMKLKTLLLLTFTSIFCLSCTDNDEIEHTWRVKHIVKNINISDGAVFKEIIITDNETIQTEANVNAMLMYTAYDLHANTLAPDSSRIINNHLNVDGDSKSRTITYKVPFEYQKRDSFLFEVNMSYQKIIK